MSSFPKFYYPKVGFESGLNKASEATRNFYAVANRDGRGTFTAKCDGEQLILEDPESGMSLKTSPIQRLTHGLGDGYLRVETQNSIISLWVYD